MKRSIPFLAVAALAAAASAPTAGFINFSEAHVPRRSAFRKGRRFNSKGDRIVQRKDNPAGTKLARKAARGQLGLIVSR